MQRKNSPTMAKNIFTGSFMPIDKDAQNLHKNDDDIMSLCGLPQAEQQE